MSTIFLYILILLITIIMIMISYLICVWEWFDCNIHYTISNPKRFQEGVRHASKEMLKISFVIIGLMFMLVWLTFAYY